MATWSLEHKLERTTKDLGLRPQALSGNYNAPTAWCSIGALGQKLDQVSRENSSGKRSLKLSQTIEGVKLSIPTLVDIHTLLLDGRLSKIMDFALRLVSKLKDWITLEADAWMYNAGSGGDPVPLSSSPASTPVLANSFVKTFEKRFDDVSAWLAKVTSKRDEQAIFFAGLSFHSLWEATAWLAIHLPDHQYGLIVNVHIDMEQVYASIEGQKVIGWLQKKLNCVF